MFTVMFEIGWCGFGAARGLVPELRLGVVRLACTRGSVCDRLSSLLRSLGDAAVEIRALMRAPR